MKKRMICMAVITSIALCGCQHSENIFLAYQDSAAATAYSEASQLTQTDFFAENLAIVTAKNNKGGDNQLTAGASLLIDTDDKKVIYADNVYNKLYPASLTKLLTALVIFRYGEMTDTVTISHNASHITESGAKLCGFQEGDQIILEDLLKCMLIYSGNDAALAIAEHIGGNEEKFVQMMNTEAKKVGAVHSNFVNPNGLHDDNQYTTAYDLYLIFNELIKNDNFRSIVGSDSYTAEYTDEMGKPIQKKFTSTDLYLNGKKTLDLGMTAIGGKTGTTMKAGHCLILLSKDKNKKEYISIILRASSSDGLYSQMTYLTSKAVEN